MKRNIFLSTMLFLLALVLCLPFCALPTTASDFPPAVTDAGTEADSSEESPYEWVLSEDKNTIYAMRDGTMEKIFTRYPLNGDFTLRAWEVYEYYNAIRSGDLNDGFDTYVYAPYKGADFIWITVDAEKHIYANAAGNAALDAYFSGESVRYYLNDALWSYSAIDEATINALEDTRKSGKDALLIDVTVLKNCLRYEIRTYDETNTFTDAYGAIYFVDGTLYYLHYASLGNEHFDANGYFSYRSGEVPLTPIEGALRAELEAAINGMETIEQSFNYEDSAPVEFPLFLFWLFYIFLGFLLPIPFLVLGLIFPHISAMGKPRYWYSVAIAAGAWIALAILLMIAILV